MRVNFYYPPYPCQIFEGENEPINPTRPLVPKTTFPTLISGMNRYSKEMGFEFTAKVIDTNLTNVLTKYKSIKYGPRIMNCYRLGTPYEQLNEQIRSAEIHGISSNNTNSAQIVADLSLHIKSVNKDALVVIGGTDATARPDYYLSRGADVIIKGEGEYVFSKLLYALSHGKDFDEVPNICTKNDPTGARHNIPYKILDMNEFEPMDLSYVDDIHAYNDTAEGPVPEGVKGGMIFFETSRGCSWGCSFCTASQRGRYRFMSPKTVRKHFEYFKNKGIRSIVWQEDNPLSRMQKSATGNYLYEKGRDEVLEIFYTARELGFSWEFGNGLEFCKFRHNGSGTKLDYELMDALLWNRIHDGVWEGCYRVQVPLDNMNLEKENRFKKLLSFKDQIDILSEMLTTSNILHQTYDLFIGYPEQDQEVIDRFTEGCLTLKKELLSKNSNFVPYFNVFNLALLPGSRDYEQYKEMLAFDIEQNPEVIGIFLSAMNTKHFNYYETYQNRLKMCNILNGAAMMKRYDGSYAGEYENEDICICENVAKSTQTVKM